MPKFKPGDRVRFARLMRASPVALVGREGVIVGLGDSPESRGPLWNMWPLDDWDCHVDFGGELRAINCLFAELEPLTDPRCMQFIEDMQRFASLAARERKVLTPAALNKVTGGSQ